MKYVKLEGLSEKASALCLGTMHFGASNDEKTSFEILDAYFEMGGNFLDTARLYGEPDGVGAGASEKVIGRWMRERRNRENVILATKGGHPPLGHMDQGRLDKNSLSYDLNESLKALDTDHVDLYWLHRDDERLLVEEILWTLNGFIKEGKIKAIGASNWTPERLRRAKDFAASNGLVGFCADQPMWSFAVNSDETMMGEQHLIQMDQSLYRFHMRSKMACIPFSAQGKGIFHKLANIGEAAVTGKTKQRYLNRENLDRFELLREISMETGLSVGTVVVCFLTCQCGFPVIPIVGASSMSQMEDLKRSADASIPDDLMKKLLDKTGYAQQAYGD